MNWMEEYPLAPKEWLLFEAVGQLLDEGKDMNRLKVSDITAKAGIGKGTAYEYFKSKEELIAKALAYRLFSGLAEITELIVQKNDFCGKIEGIFQWLEEKGGQGLDCEHFLKLSLQSYEIAKPFQEEWFKLLDHPAQGLYKAAMKDLIESGRRDGMIGPEVQDIQAGQVLFSQAVSYLMYLQRKAQMDQADVGDMKQFLCQCVYKCLK